MQPRSRGPALADRRAMIGLVPADLSTAISGIGYLIVQTATTFQIDKTFVPVVTLGLIGVTPAACARFIETRIVPRPEAGKRN